VLAPRSTARAIIPGWRYPTRSNVGRRAILVLGFVAIAAVSFVAGWLVGTVLTEHIRWI
jgi:hypothetical protein